MTNLVSVISPAMGNSIMLIITTIWSKQWGKKKKKEKKLSLPLADLYLSIIAGFKQATGAQEQRRRTMLQSQRI